MFMFLKVTLLKVILLKAILLKAILHKAILRKAILHKVHKVILHSKETKLKTVVSLKDGIFLTFSAID